MDIKNFQLHNIGQFEKLDIDLAPTETVKSNVTIFIGNNGSGKTSILKSLATSLSWLVARIRTERGSGSPIPELVIRNGSSFGSSNIEIESEKNDSMNPFSKTTQKYNWTIARTKKRYKSQQKSVLEGATDLADMFRFDYAHDSTTSFPLIAFYSVERVVVDIPLKIRTKHTFEQLDGYDNSLTWGVDFRRFFEWFREREDKENEDTFPESLLNKVDPDSDAYKILQDINARAKDRQLNAVRTAIKEFMPDFDNLCIKRYPLRMSVDKDGESLNVMQLSQGEKSLMALVGDIARRLAVMNPALENPLHGDGIVLIDEVDMHLHPQWQRQIVDRLSNTFPNCQFILTTHSPLVISDPKDVLAYELDNGELNPLESLYGEDVNSVLLGTMDTGIRNEVVENEIDKILDNIGNKDFVTAKELLEKLELELSPNNSELQRLRFLLRRQELLHEKNNKNS